jgi:uncharacterized protein
MTGRSQCATMHDLSAAPRIQLVVKISKYCNLRCAYCYEFNELSNKSRMSLKNIEHMLRNLHSAVELGQISGIEFIWHGGEPFLIPLQYYRAIGALQQEIFPDRDTYQNMVQTNLTVLTDRHIEFLKGGDFFNHIGVSFDVFGDQRVDTTGALRNDKIIGNMEKLVEHEIAFGAISVLSRDTLPHARKIQKFWETLGKGFRFLPFHLSIDDAQSQRHGLSGQEQVVALNQCFLEWLQSPAPVRIDPIYEYLAYALEYMAGGGKSIYDPSANEVVYVANVDGHISGIGQGELYGADLRYGNIFTTSFSDILTSPTRKKATSVAVARMHRYCKTCPYFGYCPGHSVADASREDMAIIEENGCTVRNVLNFMVDSLNRSEIANDLHMRLKGGSNSADSSISLNPPSSARALL